jgi:hypothetical protein
MESANYYGDGPGGSSRESHEAFERAWDAKKASMSEAEFDAWATEHSGKLVTSEKITTDVLAILKANIAGGSLPGSVRRPLRFS